MQVLLRISRGIDTFIEWVGILTYWLVPVVIMVGVWNVVGRYVGRAVGQNLTSNRLIELQWYIFSIIFLLGTAYVLKHNGHVRVDVLYGQWSLRRRAIVNLLGTCLFLIPFSLLVINFSWNSVLFSWQIQEQSPDPSGLARYPIKTFILISFGLLIIQGISEIIKNVAYLRGDIDMVEEEVSGPEAVTIPAQIKDHDLRPDDPMHQQT